MASSKKRIAFYGSCHAEAMSRLFLATPWLVDTYEVLYSLPYYLMDEQEINDFSNTVLPTIDYFIYQPISHEAENGKFATAPLLQNLKRDAVTVTFAYSHFELYSPFCLYAPSTFPEFPPLYVDYEVGALVAKGSSLEAIIEGFEHRKVIDFSQTLLEQNLSELRKREDRVLPGDRPIDVKVADYIAENFRERQLFNSMNHPSNVLLKEISERVVEKMGHTEGASGGEYFPYEGIELLNDAYTPVPPIIVEAFALKNTLNRRVLKNNEMSREKYLEMQYHYFKSVDANNILSALEQMSWSRPWFKALM